MYRVIYPNVLGTRPFGPVCVPGVPMGPTARITIGFGAGIPWLPDPAGCEVHPAPEGRRDSGF